MRHIQFILIFSIFLLDFFYLSRYVNISLLPSLIDYERVPRRNDTFPAVDDKFKLLPNFHVEINFKAAEIWIVLAVDPRATQERLNLYQIRFCYVFGLLWLEVNCGGQDFPFLHEC
jgi:hypothetical protein